MNLLLTVQGISLDGEEVVLSGVGADGKTNYKVTYSKAGFISELDKEGIKASVEAVATGVPEAWITRLRGARLNIEVTETHKGSNRLAGGTWSRRIPSETAEKEPTSNFVGWPERDKTSNFTPVRLNTNAFVPSKETWRIGYAVLDNPVQYIKQSRSSYIIEEPVLRGRDSVKVGTGDSYESITISYTANGPHEIRKSVQEVLEQLLINPFIVMEGGPFGSCRPSRIDPAKDIPYNEFAIKSFSVSSVPSYPDSLQVTINMDPFLWEWYVQPSETSDEGQKKPVFTFDDIICYPLYKIWCKQTAASKYSANTLSPQSATSFSGKFTLGFPSAETLTAIDQYLTSKAKTIRGSDSKVFETLTSLMENDTHKVTSDDVWEVNINVQGGRVFIFKVSDKRSFERWTGADSSKAKSSFRGLVWWNDYLNLPRADGNGNRIPNGNLITDPRVFKNITDGLLSSSIDTSALDLVVQIPPSLITRSTSDGLFESAVRSFLIADEKRRNPGLTDDQAALRVSDVLLRSVLQNPQDYFGLVVEGVEGLDQDLIGEKEYALLTEKAGTTNFLNQTILDFLEEKGDSMEVVLDVGAGEGEDIIIETVSATKINNLPVTSSHIHSLPIHTFIGSMGTVFTVTGKCFSDQKSGRIDGKSQLYNIKQLFDGRALKRPHPIYVPKKDVASIGASFSAAQFMVVKNEIFQLMGTDFVMPVTLDFESIDGQPGVWNFVMTFMEYDPKIREAERLKFIPTPSQFLGNPLEYGSGQVNNSTQQKALDYFALQGALLNEEVYPDLSLPTRDDLNSWIASCSRIGKYFLSERGRVGSKDRASLTPFDEHIYSLIENDLLSVFNATEMSRWPESFGPTESGLYTDPDFYCYYHETQSFGNLLDEIAEQSFGKASDTGSATTTSKPGEKGGKDTKQVVSKPVYRETDPQTKRASVSHPDNPYGFGEKAGAMLDYVLQNGPRKISDGSIDKEYLKITEQAGQQYQDLAKSRQAWWNISGIQEIGYIKIVDVDAANLFRDSWMNGVIPQEREAPEVGNLDAADVVDTGWEKFWDYDWRVSVLQKAIHNGQASPKLVDYPQISFSQGNFLIPAGDQWSGPNGYRSNELLWFPKDPNNKWNILDTRQQAVVNGRTLESLDDYVDFLTSPSNVFNRADKNFDALGLRLNTFAPELSFVERTVLLNSFRAYVSRKGFKPSDTVPGITLQERMSNSMLLTESISQEFGIDPHLLRSYFLVRGGLGETTIKGLDGGWGQLDTNVISPESSPEDYLRLFAKTYSFNLTKVGIPTFALILTDMQLTSKGRSKNQVERAETIFEETASSLSKLSREQQGIKIQQAVRSAGIDSALVTQYYTKYIETVRNLGSYQNNGAFATDLFFDPMNPLVLMDIGKDTENRGVRTKFSPADEAVISMNRGSLQRDDLRVIGNMRDELSLNSDMTAEQRAQLVNKIRLGLDPTSEDSIYGLMHDLRKYSCHGRLLKAFPAFSVVIVNDGFYWRQGTSKLWDQYYTRTAITGIEVWKSRHQPASTCTVTYSNVFHSLTRYTALEVLQQELALKEKDRNYRIFTHPLETLGKVWNEYIFKNVSKEIVQIWQNNHINALVLGAGARIHVRLGHGCVDEETEILTENGWKLYNEVCVGENILTLNHDTGMSEWQPVQKMNIYDVKDEEMLYIDGKFHSSLTTLNHRWPVIHNHSSGSGRYKTRQWKTSASLNSHDEIILSAFHSGLPRTKTYSDEFVELVSWFWTEGTIHSKNKNCVYLSQSWKANPSLVRRIRRVLTSLFGPSIDLGPGEKFSYPVETRRKVLDLLVVNSGNVNKTVRETGISHPTITRWAEDKDLALSVQEKTPAWVERTRSLPRAETQFRLNSLASTLLLEVAPNKVVSRDFLKSLTQEQLELFIEVSEMADGRGTSLGQKDYKRSESFEFACILAGKRAHTWSRLDKTRDYLEHIVGFSNTKTYTLGRAQKQSKRVRYTGKVWCPTTKNSTWFARRNGCSFYTGNSNSAQLPVIFNGTVVEAPVSDDTVTLIAVGDGVELEKPSVNKLYPSVDGYAYTDGGIWGQAKAPINIVTEALINIEGIGSNITEGRFFRDWSHGIAHFGDVYFDGILTNPVELTFNLYNSRSTTLEQYVPAIRNYFNTNALYNWDETVEFSIEVSEPTPWKVIEVCRRAVMDFVASAEPFCTWSTVFFGKWWWPFHYQFDGSILSLDTNLASVSEGKIPGSRHQVVVPKADRNNKVSSLSGPWSRDTRGGSATAESPYTLRGAEGKIGGEDLGGFNLDKIYLVHMDNFRSYEDKVAVLRALALAIKNKGGEPREVIKIEWQPGPVYSITFGNGQRMVISYLPTPNTDYSSRTNTIEGDSNYKPQSIRQLSTGEFRDAMKGHFDYKALDLLKNVQILTSYMNWKPFSQIHVVHSYLNLLHNGLKTDGTQVCTDAMGRYLFNGVLTKTGVDKTITWSIDDDIHPSSRRTMMCDTGILLTTTQRGIPRTLQKWTEYLPFTSNITKGTATTPAVENSVVNTLLDTVKEMYQGWMTISAQPTIKPRDFLLFKDVKTGLTGPLMVKSVVHKLDSQVGYVTMISPDCVVLPHSSVLGSNLLTGAHLSVLHKLGAIWAAKSLWISGKSLTSSVFGTGTKKATLKAYKLWQWETLTELSKDGLLYSDPIEIGKVKLRLLKAEHLKNLEVLNEAAKSSPNPKVFLERAMLEPSKLGLGSHTDVSEILKTLDGLGDQKLLDTLSELGTKSGVLDEIFKSHPEVFNQELFEEIRLLSSSVDEHTDEAKNLLKNTFFNTFRNINDFNEAVEERVFDTEISAKLDKLLEKAVRGGLLRNQVWRVDQISHIDQLIQEAETLKQGDRVKQLKDLRLALQNSDAVLSKTEFERLSRLLGKPIGEIVEPLPTRAAWEAVKDLPGTVWRSTVGPYVDIAKQTGQGSIENIVDSLQRQRAVAGVTDTVEGAVQASSSTSGAARTAKEALNAFRVTLKEEKGVKEGLQAAEAVLKEAEVISRLKKGVKAGVLGARLLSHGANPIVSIFFDLYLMTIGDSIARAENLKMRARQCAKILPLFVNGQPWTAGILGHQGACFTPDTPILMADLTEKPISEVRAGDYVITHEGRPRMVTATFIRPYSGPILSIRPLRNSLPLRCTPEHPILAKMYRGSEHKWGWRMAAELAPRDFIAEPLTNELENGIEVIDTKKYLQEGGYDVVCKDGRVLANGVGNKERQGVPEFIALTKPFLQLLGYYLAEGHTAINQGYRTSFTFHSKEIDFHNDVIEALEELGVPYFVADRRLRSQPSNCVDIKASSKTFALLMYCLCGRLAWEKKMHKDLLMLSPDKQRHIYTCWARGDGWSGKYETVVTSTSVELIRQMYLVAQRLNIKAGIQVRGRLIGKMKRPTYLLCVSDDDNPGYSRVIEDRKVIKPIKFIEENDFDGYVHNLEVEEDHSYLANFMAVHNCIGDEPGWYDKFLMGVFGGNPSVSPIAISPEAATCAAVVAGLLGFEIPDYTSAALPQDRAYLKHMQEAEE